MVYLRYLPPKRTGCTDLDHNGRLEVIAAALHPVDHSNNVHVYELNADGSAFQELRTVVPEGESFPDILSDTADTFYDASTGSWSYLFTDHLAISTTEVYDVICSVTLKDSSISYQQYALSHTEIKNGIMSTSYIDNNGLTISGDAYSASGINHFPGAERSSTNFAWLSFEDVTSVSVVKDSYSIFTGEKEPDKTTTAKPTVGPTVAVPVQTMAPQATPAPAPAVQPTPAPAPKPTYLSVTKNPTNENRKVGDKALFVANATIFDYLTWTLVAPNGGEYSVANFRNVFPRSTVSGEYSTTLSIANLEKDMNGWGAYCTFNYNGQTARTSTAYIMIKDSAQPSGSGTVYGSASGTVYHDTAYTVYVVLQNGASASLSASLCNIAYGDFVDGSSCTVYYAAYPNGNYDIYRIDIYGKAPAPVPPAPTPYVPVQPTYKSISGKAYHDTAFTEYIVCSNGVTAQVNGYLCNIVSGTYVDGCDCTVYYTQYADGSYEITSVDIYGVYNPYLDDDTIGASNPPVSDVGTALSVSDWGDGSYTVWESDGSWTSYEADGSFTDYDPYGNIVGGGMSY